MSSELSRAVEAEILGMHEALVAWFTGAVTPDALEPSIGARLAPEFHYVFPAGVTRTRAELLAMLREGHGSNDAFAISIVDVVVRAHAGDLAVVQYEERQAAAKNSDPPDNVRLSTVTFRREGDRYLWVHLHETAKTAGA